WSRCPGTICGEPSEHAERGQDSNQRLPGFAHPGVPVPADAMVAAEPTLLGSGKGEHTDLKGCPVTSHLSSKSYKKTVVSTAVRARSAGRREAHVAPQRSLSRQIRPFAPFASFASFVATKASRCWRRSRRIPSRTSGP